jgi:two-component system, cell cycle sensor histidine kinase and response regulator CckA
LQCETQYLRSKGYTVLEASDGQEAVKTAREYSGAIHLMIADAVMPNMSGCQAAEQIRNFRPAMKVLYVSGYADRTLERHRTDNYALAFLQKPYTLKMLGQKVRSLFRSDDPVAQRDEASVPKADLATL